jgi:hypothetical protein
MQDMGRRTRSAGHGAQDTGRRTRGAGHGGKTEGHDARAVSCAPERLALLCLARSGRGMAPVATDPAFLLLLTGA